MKINLNNNFWPSFWIIIALGAVLILGTSCSCSYHLKKVHAKCPTAFERDTVLVHDTLRVHETRTDTIFEQTAIGDTVYIEKGRLKIQYVNLGGGRHKIAGKCDTVFIPRKIKVPYTKTVIKDQSTWEKVTSAIGQTFLLLLVFFLLFLWARYWFRKLFSPVTNQ